MKFFYNMYLPKKQTKFFLFDLFLHVIYAFLTIEVYSKTKVDLPNQSAFKLYAPAVFP